MAPGAAMRLTCPLCGERDLREFAYRGSAKLLARPAADAGAAAFHDYLNLRDNPAGPNAGALAARRRLPGLAAGGARHADATRCSRSALAREAAR